ncbi:hypothetical protein FX983_02805 [Pseudomonas frederiksbergensis]|uniref:Uncharacterized protein n=1 Tax=Pseudomonas frederiksbergensis TaxID=104087 RepID=A0A6L5C2D4_9PSED|nr:hypothetical protein FX984_00642 [Pseudomonas marginalis]KAF2394823.1 hypothetical protein FX983_02805 [Pseudomonas frederiksbergensis]
MKTAVRSAAIGTETLPSFHWGGARLAALPEGKISSLELLENFQPDYRLPHSAAYRLSGICTMRHDKQNLRSNLPNSPIARRTWRSLDAALDSRTPVRSEAIQGHARDSACNGYKPAVRTPGHAGPERRHSTSHATHASYYASLRADGFGRAITQTSARVGILGTGSADRRAHRSGQCSCGAHSPLPDKRERFGDERRFAGAVRVSGGGGGLPCSSKRRDPVGTVWAKHRAHRRQDTVRHGNLHRASPAPDHSNACASRRARKAAARGSASVYTCVQSTRVQALRPQALYHFPSLHENRGALARRQPPTRLAFHPTSCQTFADPSAVPILPLPT